VNGILSKKKKKGKKISMYMRINKTNWIQKIANIIIEQNKLKEDII